MTDRFLRLFMIRN